MQNSSSSEIMKTTCLLVNFISKLQDFLCSLPPFGKSEQFLKLLCTMDKCIVLYIMSESLLTMELSW